MFAVYYSLAAFLALTGTVESLRCYSCFGISKMDSCSSKVACRDGQICFKNRTYTEQVSFDLGCVEKQRCGVISNLAASTTESQTHSCYECCSSDSCNKGLCNHSSPSLCVDNELYDCAFLNSMFNICKNINKAKQLCPKFCELCNVVDGNWSPWSRWSECDVTCDNGTQSRTRSCTDPAPEHGGRACPGKATDVKLCFREICPVHGHWSGWEEWGSCSASCGMGMQSRDRTCTNPAPSRYGEHCFGHSQEYRLCDNGSCGVHGNWSEWEEWGSCSVSCGMGMQSRDRTCTNPAPKGSGEHCFGHSQQYRLCDTGPCGVNGNWSEWEEWGSCSVSCGMGMQSRGRKCTNPAPKGSGEHCFGHSQEYRLCHNGSCADYNVAFTATNVNNSGTSNAILQFRSVYLNKGDAYNTATGKFTCRIPGVYYFAVTLTKRYKDINSLYAYLRINGISKLDMFFNPDDDNSNELVSLPLTTSGTFHLNTNDTVDVIGTPSYFYTAQSSFTGILVFPDQ